MRTKIYNAVSVTGTNTYYSEIFNGLTLGPDLISAQLEGTGTPTGTLTLWASNKLDPITSSDADWVDITSLVTVVNPAGSFTKQLVRLSNGGACYYRMKYVNSSGSGTITGWAYAAAHR